MQDLPYWRLSGFYFFYFALLGSYVPYWTLYLKELGFSALEIGYLSGAMMATKIVAPNLWGYLADHSGRRLLIVRLGALLALVFFCGIFLSRGFAWLLLVVVGFSFFWNAILSQFEVITLDHLGNQYSRYSQVRVWGSLGFITLVVGLGWFFEHMPLNLLPVVMASLLAAIWVCSHAITETDGGVRVERGGRLGDILRKNSVWAFFLVCFLLQLAYGPYYTFFSLYLEQAGYGRGLIGQLWALGVAAEVALFLFMHRLLPRFGVRRIMIGSLLLAVLRWLLTAYAVTNLPLLLFSQCLHAATFGAFHAASIEFIRRNFPAHLAGQGQAIYGAVSFGAGGAVGAVASGYLWDFGSDLTFLMAAFASALASFLAWRFIHVENS